MKSALCFWELCWTIHRHVEIQPDVSSILNLVIFFAGMILEAFAARIQWKSKFNDFQKGKTNKYTHMHININIIIWKAPPFALKFLQVLSQAVAESYKVGFSAVTLGDWVRELWNQKSEERQKVSKVRKEERAEII